MNFYDDSIVWLPEENIRWTKQAYFCYKINCDCTKCDIAYNYETLNRQTCHMRYIVQALLLRRNKNV